MHKRDKKKSFKKNVVQLIMNKTQLVRRRDNIQQVQSWKKMTRKKKKEKKSISSWLAALLSLLKRFDSLCRALHVVSAIKKVIFHYFQSLQYDLISIFSGKHKNKLRLEVFRLIVFVNSINFHPWVSFF